MVGLYIHIPFCKSICSYCDFVKRVTLKESTMREYLDLLRMEMKEKIVDTTIFDTIYIGGGTPNSLPDSLLEELLKLVFEYTKGSNILEYTIECNPDLVTAFQAELYHKYHVNRISLGVQTISSRLLKLIGRTHSKQSVTEAIEALKKENICNINLDFMMDIPTQTKEELREDLMFIQEIQPSHISYYDFILEEQSIFGYLSKNGKLKCNDEDTQVQFYETTVQFLKNVRYHHYEISNFSKPGYESIHNLKYWTEKEYLGIGVSACSFIQGKRINNTKDLQSYKNSVFCNEEEVISESEMLKEEFLLGLRKIDGVSLEYISKKYKIDPLSYFPKIQERVQEGLLEIDRKGYLKLTKRGLLLGNLIFEDFVGELC